MATTPTLEQVGELRIALAKVVDPNGGVSQYQAAASSRLRGAAFKLGCVPAWVRDRRPLLGLHCGRRTNSVDTLAGLAAVHGGKVRMAQGK
jgi:hypothetical protein